MVTGLYGSLATSASVFIGILTALLTSKLTNLVSERNRIDRRVRAIDSRLRGLSRERDQLEERIENIEEAWREQELQEEAEEQVDDFIEKYIGDEYDPDPDDVEIIDIVNAFANYAGISVTEINEYQEESIRNRHEDIVAELRPTLGAIDFGSMDIPTDPTYHQIEQQWTIYEREQYNQNERQWIEIKAEIRGLRRERQKLEDRHQSIDIGQIRSTLNASAVAIGFAVFVPLLAYFVRETGFTIIPAPIVAETVLVFLAWVFGLGYVLLQIRKQIKNEGDQDGLPDKPDIDGVE